MKRRIFIILGIISIFVCAYGLLRYRVLSWLLFLALGIYFIYSSKPKEEKDKTVLSSNASLPAENTQNTSSLEKGFSFPIVGVTFKNDDGSDRQKLLRKIFFKDLPFDIEQNVTLERYLWKDSPAYYVKVNGYIVGNISSDFVWYFEKNSNRPYKIDYIEVYGGGGNKNYGAEIHGIYLDL